MAKLLPPFILCPLSERKEFLGISADHKENKVILTIGKNIAIRYHVLEQKQEVSWISSRHWFTSRVVYCPDLEQYAAVIDCTTVILFDEHDSNLSSMKKYKFAKPIFGLKPTKSLGTVVVFKNGAVKSLSHVVGLKKQTVELELRDILNPADEVLVQADIDEKRNQAVLMIGFSNEVQTTTKCGMDKLKRIKVFVLDLHRIHSNVSKVKFTTVIEKEERHILGFAVNRFSEIGSTVVYLCSDGYLYQELLMPPAIHEDNNDDKSSVGQSDANSKVAHLEKYVSSSNAVIIESLDSSSVIIYGCDPSEEGACVLVYDINYNILITRQSLKLYSSPPTMERIGPHIFVPVGLHILALGLRLTKTRLSAVVGKHQIQAVDLFEKREPFIRPWYSLTNTSDTDKELLNGDAHGLELMDVNDVEMSFSTKEFENMYKLVKILEKDGQPESMICGQIVPQAIEARDTEALKWINEYFYDMPESALISILTFLMTTSSEGEGGSATDGSSKNPSSHLINGILERNFDQRQLLHEFRRLDFETVQIFLQYFWRRMNELWSVKVVSDSDDDEDDEGKDVHKHEELLQIFKWTCVVFDAQYPQFVSKNETELVDKIFTFINEKFKLLEEVESLEPLLTLILSKISYEPKPAGNVKYRVETVTFE